MVVLYSKSKGGPTFFAPADDASGGTSSSGASNNGGGQNGGGGTNIVSPFKDLPWDELDDESRASLKEAEKTTIATLQSVEKLKADLERETKLAKQFQSEADILKEKVKKLDPQQQQQQQTDPYLETVKQELLSAGYPEAEAVRLSPVFANMFRKVGVLERDKLGKDLAPMGATVLASQAQDAFQTAVSVDPLGLFQAPEIKEAVWQAIQERVKAGEQTTPEFVLNLGKIIWADDLAAKRAKGEEITLPTVPVKPSTPGMNTGGVQFTFPGAGGSSFSPIAQPVPAGDAPKHVLNADTQAALAATFKAMGGEQGLYPKSLKDIITKGRRH